MSDKETAPCPHVSLKRQNVGNQRWYKCLSCPQKFKAAESDGKVTAIAAECTAPAPQTDWKKEALALVVLLRAKCSEEEWANMESRLAAASPQVTPSPCALCGAPWTKAHAEFQEPCKPEVTSGQASQVTPSVKWVSSLCPQCGGKMFDNTAFYRCTGICKKAWTSTLGSGWVEFETADTPQVTPSPAEVSREPHDGWMNAWLYKNIPKDKNCLYLWNREVRKLAGDWADFRAEVTSGPAEAPTPAKCPTCGSSQKWSEATAVAAYNNGRANFCQDEWHSSVATQKEV